MTTPDWAALQRRTEEAEQRAHALEQRIAALEAAQFEADQQLARVGRTADSTAAGLDGLEEAIYELTSAMPDPALDADALAAAMAQRQAQLDAGPGPQTVPNPLIAPTPQGALMALNTDGAPADPIPQNGAWPMDDPAVADPPSELAVLHAWVSAQIAPLVRKTTTTGEGGGVRWCRRWWEHEDARTRFQALYLAWDELSQEESATWLSVYLRDHLDPHLSTLTSPFGPFYACHPARHSDTVQELGQDALPDEETAVAVGGSGGPPALLPERRT